MALSMSDKEDLINTLLLDLDGKTDGGRRNILVPVCPMCGHTGYKFGIRIKDSNGKSFGASHCFSCGRSNKTLADTLRIIGREDLIPQETTQLDDVDFVQLFEDLGIDTSLVEVEMPKGYKRTFKHWYLKSRKWIPEDYEYFEVGTNRALDWRFEDYVIIPIIDNGVKVGYLGRHTWSKDAIDEYNDTHRRKIMRYRNSTEAEGGNPFSKLLYNIDAVQPFITRTVILCEGVFDVIGLTRRLELYENPDIQAVATFGKKISDVQICKLQEKGVRTLVIGYDADAAGTVAQLAKELDQWFDVFVCDLSFIHGKDFDEMTVGECYEVFANHLLSVREFNL